MYLYSTPLLQVVVILLAHLRDQQDLPIWPTIYMHWPLAYFEILVVRRNLLLGRSLLWHFYWNVVRLFASEMPSWSTLILWVLLRHQGRNLNWPSYDQCSYVLRMGFVFQLVGLLHSRIPKKKVSVQSTFLVSYDLPIRLMEFLDLSSLCGFQSSSDRIDYGFVARLCKSICL